MTDNFGKREIRPRSRISSERLADRGTVAQVAAGNDDVVGRLPVELLEQFERESFLAFEAKGIDRIQLIDGRAQNQFLQQAQATVEVGAQLAGDGTVVERLREFAPGNFAVGHKHQAAHASASGVGGHRRRGIAGGGAGNPAKSGESREGCGHRHAGVFEGAGGIQSLMFGEQARHAGDARALRKFVEWRVTLAQRDGLLVGLRARAEDRGSARRRFDRSVRKTGGDCARWISVSRRQDWLPSSEDR